MTLSSRMGWVFFSPTSIATAYAGWLSMIFARVGLLLYPVPSSQYPILDQAFELTLLLSDILIVIGALPIAAYAILSVGKPWYMSTRDYTEAKAHRAKLGWDRLERDRDERPWYPINSFGKFKRVAETELTLKGGEEYCEFCDRSMREGIRYRRYIDTVAFGIALTRERGGERFECKECAESDPIDLALRTNEPAHETETEIETEVTA